MYNFIGLLFSITILSIIVALYISYSTYTAPNLLTPNQAKFLISKNRIQKVIDARTALEYDSGHYPGAIQISVHSMNKDLVAMKDVNKKDNILVYCKTGKRAKHASILLKSYGYPNVFYISEPYTSLL